MFSVYSKNKRTGLIVAILLEGRVCMIHLECPVDGSTVIVQYTTPTRTEMLHYGIKVIQNNFV